MGRETGAIVGARWPCQALRQVRALGVAATGEGQWVLVEVLSCRSGAQAGRGEERSQQEGCGGPAFLSRLEAPSTCWPA